MSFYADKISSEKANLSNQFFDKSKKMKQISLLNNGGYSPTPNEANTKSGKRTAFRAFRRGSLTVEAAIILPLFFMGVLACIWMMRVYALHMEATVRLQEQAEKLGMYAHTAELPGEENIIDLTERIEFQIPFFPLPALEFDCRGRVAVWVGRQNGENESETGKNTTLVYMAENGSVYHTTSRCSHLALNIRQIPAATVDMLRNEQGGKYRACEKCVGEGAKTPLLFVTDRGDCYHNSLECSGLKRSVRLVELESLEGVPCCSRCAEMAAGSI